MTKLQVKSGQQIIDEVTLVDGKLKFKTGLAEDLFSNKKFIARLSDAEIFKELSDWSNGKVVISEIAG